MQQGWQCPICGAIYSPTTMACANCTGWKISNNFVDNKSVFDWVHNDVVTKTEDNKTDGETK